MGWELARMMEKKNAQKVMVGKPKERVLGVDGKIILKYILK
jgi:hypothetical protein